MEYAAIMKNITTTQFQKLCLGCFGFFWFSNPLVFKPFVQNSSPCSTSWRHGHVLPQPCFPGVRKLVSIQTKYKIIRILDKKIICTILIVLKMSTVKVLTGGNSTGESLLLASCLQKPRVPALASQLPQKQTTKIHLHCKADKQVSSSKEGFLL